MKLLAFLLVGSLTCIPSLKAQPIPITPESGGVGRPYQRWESGPWQVLAGPDYCAADFEIPNMQFAVELYWWTGQMRLQVMSRNWLSLRQRAGQRARLTFALDNLNAWSNQATIVGNNEVGGFFMDLEGSDARSVTSRLASGRVLEIIADGRTLGSYPLQNSDEAMVELERCAILMRTNDRSDPFARQQ